MLGNVCVTMDAHLKFSHQILTHFVLHLTIDKITRAAVVGANVN